MGSVSTVRRPESAAPSTVDPDEIRHFDAHSGVWWDVAGVARWIHQLNPLRVGYTIDLIARTVGMPTPGRLAGLRILDLGCGAGVFTEELARIVADVVGIDPGPALIDVATAHAKSAELAIDYRCATPEALVATGDTFDVVLAYDVAEHVANPTLFFESCADLVKPGGLLVVSTMNRTVRAYVQAILLGEYVLRFLPRGSHDWRKFITPSEVVEALRPQGFSLVEVRGLTMDLRRWKLRISRNASVTYFIAMCRNP